MSEAETLPDKDAQASPRAAPLSLVLTTIWAPSEGHLLGSSLIPLRDTVAVFGRGEATDDGLPRLRLVGLRPGEPYRPEPVANHRLSRHQLQVRGGDERLRLDNVGLCPLVVGGQEVRSCEVSPGDVVVLGHQMAFLCVRRPLPARQPTARSHAFGEADAAGLVGESEAAWALRRDVEFMATRDTHVLVLGPSGAGKELVAHAIHDGSKRAGKPLVARNAATIPETLVDAELFGNAKNYPNPGMAERPGLIGQAHQSTLFLDEFAELPQALQAHLLRVLDAGEYQRLGEATARTSNFRLVAATNRPLDALKEDVAARFLLRLRVPDLNERREDIPLIARHLLRQIGGRDLRAVERFFPAGDLSAEPRLSRDLVLDLVSRPYRTHVRELFALLWDSLRHSSGDVLELPPTTLPRVSSSLPPPLSSPPPPVVGPVPPEEDAMPDESTLSAAEVQRALDAHNGSLEKTWRALGLANRYVLRRLVHKFRLQIRKQGGLR